MFVLRNLQGRKPNIVIVLERQLALEGRDALGLPLAEDDICNAAVIQKLASTSDR